MCGAGKDCFSAPHIIIYIPGFGNRNKGVA